MDEPVEVTWHANATVGDRENMAFSNGHAPPYTHEAVSKMLGVNLTSVTLASEALQAVGLISYVRGKMKVLDRPGLEKASCECYAIVKARFDDFLGPPSYAVKRHTIRHERK